MTIENGDVAPIVERDVKVGKSQLEVISGCMFSGKTEELLRLLTRADIARLRVQVFKPEIDKRYSEDSVYSHVGKNRLATNINPSEPWDILRKLDKEARVIGIDEAQFFGKGIVQVCRTLVDTHKLRVIVAGLNQDFRGEPFGHMPELMAAAEEVIQTTAVCDVCGADATRTQRVIVREDGLRVPASYDSAIVVVGGKEAYEARCNHHHEVPGRPELKLEEVEHSEKIRFLLSGVGEVEDRIQKILLEMGHRVYRPPVSEDVGILDEDERNKARLIRGKCHAAIFGPGKNNGIGEVREWGSSKRPSLGFVRAGDGTFKPYSPFYSRIEVYQNDEILVQAINNFLTEVRIQLKDIKIAEINEDEEHEFLSF